MNDFEKAHKEAIARVRLLEEQNERIIDALAKDEENLMKDLDFFLCAYQERRDDGKLHLDDDGYYGKLKQFSDAFDTVLNLGKCIYNYNRAMWD